MTTETQNNKEIYNLLYSNGYPHGGLGFPIKWSGIQCDELTCLDIGCGHGILCKRFKKYVGIDVSDYIINRNKKKYPGIEFYSSDIIDITPKYFEHFDIVISIDVLEHLPKNEIEKYLKKISEIETDLFLFSICCRKSGYRSTDNGELHTCLMSMEEWIKKITVYFKICSYSELNGQKTFCIMGKNK